MDYLKLFPDKVKHLHKLPPDEFKAVMMAVLNMAFTGEVPDAEEMGLSLGAEIIMDGLIESVQQTADSYSAKVANGSKGGRPTKKPTETEAKANETEQKPKITEAKPTETEAKANETETPQETRYKIQDTRYKIQETRDTTVCGVGGVARACACAKPELFEVILFANAQGIRTDVDAFYAFNDSRGWNTRDWQ